MIKEFYKTLIDLIVIVSLLLAACVAVDYAANNDTITNINDTSNDGMIQELKDNVTIVNGSYILPKGSGKAVSDGKIYTDKKVQAKPKMKTVTINAKPSCGCRYGYYWHTFTFKDYCPNCGRHNCLINKHKWAARYENELTCKYCDSDFCGCCGKEKMSYSKKYLTKA